MADISLIVLILAKNTNNFYVSTQLAVGSLAVGSQQLAVGSRQSAVRSQ